MQSSFSSFPTLVKKIGQGLGKLILASSILIALLLMIPLLPGAQNWYQVAIVQSGSMEPSLPVGSLAIYRPQEKYSVGEIVAFLDKESRLIIHRITKKELKNTIQVFLMQGDATAYLSPQPVYASQIEGELVGVIPRIGYGLEFLQSPLGISLMMGGLLLLIMSSWWQDGL